MEKLRQFWRHTCDNLDQRTPRERTMILVLALMVIILGWTWLISSPTTSAMQEARQQSERLQQEIVVLQAEAERIHQQYLDDPNRPLRQTLQELQGQQAALDVRIDRALEKMIDPTTMVQLLRDLLQSQKNLTLVRLESIQGGPVEVYRNRAEAEASGLPRPYRHGLRLELEGDFFSFLEYLRGVEALPWNLYWETLEYQVVNHPRARIYLEIYTLGTQENWIGV
ncbi:type II secretion system protein GspM [Desulfurispira natronophila]|uniref:MSHA biogenesis protein MshJ n=1 Tax=Desulfurispira natronophila TaxID=682562 RepID=A0A7W8DGE4_9BACT|nr:type II secretion system protein GspM [Desulfurispira natronophila]MBB5021269.1 MSHA biogenesis protein MshJ [Desulfurispira natronophila]